MKQKMRTTLAMGLVSHDFYAYVGNGLGGPGPDNFTAKIVTMGLSMPMAKMGNKTRWNISR